MATKRDLAIVFLAGLAWAGPALGEDKVVRDVTISTRKDNLWFNCDNGRGSIDVKRIDESTVAWTQTTGPADVWCGFGIPIFTDWSATRIGPADVVSFRVKGSLSRGRPMVRLQDASECATSDYALALVQLSRTEPMTVRVPVQTLSTMGHRWDESSKKLIACRVDLNEAKQIVFSTWGNAALQIELSAVKILRTGS